jgi:sensor histidine kinase YesM
MDNSNYLSARKWIKIVAGPIAMSVILILWHTVFKDEDEALFSLLIIGGINMIFFYLSYYIISPKSVNSESLKRIIISTILFSTIFTCIHLLVFGFQLIKLPFPFNTTDYPISFFISLLFIIALTTFLSGLSLHLVINHLSISHESMSLLQKSYKNKIDTLKLQMNPHFIANALNNLSGLIRDENIIESIDYTSELIGLIGSQINSTTSMSVPIKEEMQWLESYLKMEKNRMQQSFDYKISFDPKINANATIPPMLLQPIIENSIIHGFDSEFFAKKGLIEISINKRRSSSITIEIKDNGLGINAPKAMNQRNRKSVSTENINNRIKLINEMGDFYIRKNTKIDQNGALIVIYIDPPFV